MPLEICCAAMVGWANVMMSGQPCLFVTGKTWSALALNDAIASRLLHRYCGQCPHPPGALEPCLHRCVMLGPAPCHGQRHGLGSIPAPYGLHCAMPAEIGSRQRATMPWPTGQQPQTIPSAAATSITELYKPQPRCLLAARQSTPTLQRYDTGTTVPLLRLLSNLGVLRWYPAQFLWICAGIQKQAAREGSGRAAKSTAPSFPASGAADYQAGRTPTVGDRYSGSNGSLRLPWSAAPEANAPA